MSIVSRPTDTLHTEWTAKHKRILMALLAGGLLLRLVLLFVVGKPWDAAHWHEWVWTTDSASYQVMTDDLRDGYQNYPSFRLHGYPIFLLLTEDLLGVRYLGTILIQQLLILFSAYLLARMLIPVARRFALVAAGAFLIEPSTLIYTFQVQPEALMITSEIAATYLLFKAIGSPFRRQIGYVAAMGTVLVIGTLNKPVLMYAFGGLGLILLLWDRQPLWRRAALVVMLAAIVQAPLMVIRGFNHTYFGYHGLSTQESWEKAARAVIVKQIATRGNYNQILMRRELNELGITRGDSVRGTDSAQRDSLCKRLASEIVRQYPLATATSEVFFAYMFFQPATADVKRFFFIPVKGDSTDVLGSTTNLSGRLVRRLNSPFAVLFVSFCAVLFAAMLAGYLASLAMIRDRRVQPWLAAITGWFLYTVLLVGPLADARYRLSFAWGFCAAMGIGLCWWTVRRKVRAGQLS